MYFNVCYSPVFENTTSTRKDLMLVMVFSAKMRRKFPELNFEFIWMVLILILIVPNFSSLYP